MNAAYLVNHITLTTGRNTRTSRADVADDVMAIVAPWFYIHRSWRTLMQSAGWRILSDAWRGHGLHAILS